MIIHHEKPVTLPGKGPAGPGKYLHRARPGLSGNPGPILPGLARKYPGHRPDGAYTHSLWPAFSSSRKLGPLNLATPWNIMDFHGRMDSSRDQPGPGLARGREMQVPEPLATPAEVAEVLRVKVKTLAEWRYLKKGPAFHKAGHSVRYEWRDVDAYLRSVKRGAAEAATGPRRTRPSSEPSAALSMLPEMPGYRKVMRGGRWTRP
jgi:Helix-turn-helix domain